MNRRTIVDFASLLSLPLLGLLGPLACSNAPEPSRPTFDNETGGSAGASGNSTGSGSGSGSSTSNGTKLSGSGGNGPALSTGTAGNASPSGCDEQVEKARLTPVNIVFVIDRSGSMGKQDAVGASWDNTEKRWNPVRDAMIAFFQNPGTEGLKASLTFFPADGVGQPKGPEDGVCKTGKYESPASKLRSLDDPAESQRLIDTLNQMNPGGGTPTLPALTGSLHYAESLMTKDPGSQSVVVLVTDGEPGVADNGVNQQCSCYLQPGCEDRQDQEIELVADAAKAGAQLKIPTYVIGMGEADKSSLNEIAAAGGTEEAFMVSLDDPAETKKEFTAALSSVRSVQGPCKMQIPEPPKGETFDKTKVNVRYTSGGGVVQELYYAGHLMGGSQATCPDPGPPAPSNPWFWQYDNEENPSQIILCDSACNKTSADIDGKVSVVYGCVIRVP